MNTVAGKINEAVAKTYNTIAILLIASQFIDLATIFMARELYKYEEENDNDLFMF